MKGTTRQGRTEVITKLKIENRKGRASWERYGGDALSILEADRHLSAGWVQLVMTEHGSKSSKTTFFCLDGEQVQKLREFLA